MVFNSFDRSRMAMVEEPPPDSIAGDDGTKIFYYMDDEDTPYLIKIDKPKEQVTLGDFRNALKRPNCKYFFKSLDNDIGVVKEEIGDENARLPISESGRIVAWLVSADGSSGHSQSEHGRPTAQCSQAAPNYRTAAAAFDATANTTDSEQSTLSRLPAGFKSGRLDRRVLQSNFKQSWGRASGKFRDVTGDMTLTTTDADGHMDSDEDDKSTRVSTSTDITSVSRQFMKRRRRKRQRHIASRASSVATSVTESSLSLNIITVILNMDTVNFLGISIVGQTVVGTQKGDGGIFVAHIMKGGAVALDGRIEPGDMILQVNDMSFENLTNDDAVAVLRNAVQTPGPIKLVVAKCWEPTSSRYFSLQRNEPVRPIDPGAWVAHTNAMRALPSILEGSEGAPTPVPSGVPVSHALNVSAAGSGGHYRPGSCAARSAVSGHSGSGCNEMDLPPMPPLSTETSMDLLARCMARPDSGLDVHDRTWLKITIPNAFLGSDVVDWLQRCVVGLQERKDARKYAARLLKERYIKHVVNKITFSDQCYYVFGDLVGDVAAMRIGDAGEAAVVSAPPPAHMSTGQQHNRSGPGSDPGTQSEHDSAGNNLASGGSAYAPAPHPPNSVASGYASMPFQYGGMNDDLACSAPSLAFRQDCVQPPASHMATMPVAAWSHTQQVTTVTAATAKLTCVPPAAASKSETSGHSTRSSTASGGSHAGSDNWRQMAQAGPPLPPKPQHHAAEQQSQAHTGLNTTKLRRVKFDYLMAAAPIIRPFAGPHTQCRQLAQPYLRSNITRVSVPDSKLPWSVSVSKDEYVPVDHKDMRNEGRPFVDPDIGAPGFCPLWNQVDGTVDRRSFMGQYAIDPTDGRPLNPLGRTGLRGRGVLGRWGPNHAADPIVTRWKPGALAADPSVSRVLQFVAIQRRDTGAWAIPGGMVDAGETVSDTLRREFSEEAFNSLQNSRRDCDKWQRLQLDIDKFFQPQNGLLVYKGYVDDPRNTDNSWMETVAVNYHDESGSIVGSFDLQAGDDAQKVCWMDIDKTLDLYASHVMFVKAVAEYRNALW